MSKKLEACVFCMFHYVLAWRTYNRIILLHVCAAFHSHAANKCYDVLSKAEGEVGGGQSHGAGPQWANIKETNLN